MQRYRSAHRVGSFNLALVGEKEGKLISPLSPRGIIGRP